MVLDIIKVWVRNTFDAMEALLHGEFEEDAEPIYMKVPEVFWKFYRS